MSAVRSLLCCISSVTPGRVSKRRIFERRRLRSSRNRVAGEELEDRRVLSTVTMSANEQLLVELVNLARQNPAAEVSSRAGVSLNQGITDPSKTISNTAKQPLAPHQALTNAAILHSVDMLNYDYFAHTNLNGQSPSDRARAAGYGAGAGENIAWSGTTGTLARVQMVYDRHAALLKSPGHRQNILNENYREIGNGIRYGVFTDGASYNAIMVTENFGNRGGNSFITGVAYSDSIVDDNFYTVGEGAGGILISAFNNQSGQTFSVNTGSSGGYSLQVPNGTYTVTAIGGSMTGQQVFSDVVVSSRNVKVDVVTTDPPTAASSDTHQDPLPTNGVAIAGLLGSTWWHAESTGLNFVVDNKGEWSDEVNWIDIQTADVDGDGDDDIIGRGNGTWWVSRAEDGEFTDEAWGNWSTRVHWRNVNVGDFNGDGRDDIIGQTPNGAWWVSVSDGNQFNTELWGRWSTRVNWTNITIGDFNGDGSDDVVGRADNGSWWVGEAAGGEFDMNRWGHWSPNVDWTNVDVGDFNGDGRDELIGRAGAAWWVAESTGFAFVNRLWDRWSTRVRWDDIQIGDLDADGVDELLGRTNGGWWVTRNTGTNVVTESWGRWSTNANWKNVMLFDVDRDGRDDVIGRTGADWYVSLSDGQSLETSLWGRFPSPTGWHDILVGNFE